ncbi:MAG: hypothetical protein ABL958_13700, partial [Bdellovibrionia bacterium]
MKSTIATVIVMCLFALNAQAAKKIAEKLPDPNSVTPMFEGPSSDELKEAKAELARYVDQKAEKRKVAGITNPTESDLTQKEALGNKSFEHFRDVFLNEIHTPADIDKVLKPFEDPAYFAEFPIDVQFVVNQLLLIRPLKGILHRSENVFKTSNRIMAYSVYVKLMKDIASKLELYFPTEESRVAFQYLMEPNLDKGTDGKLLNPVFTTVGDFQNLLTGPVTESLKNFARRTQVMQAKLRTLPQREFVFDRRLTFGDGTFGGDIDRFRSVGAAELMLSMVYAKRALYTISYFSAYNIDDFMAVQDEMERMKVQGEAINWLEEKLTALPLPSSMDNVGFTNKIKTLAITRHPNFLKRRGLGGAKSWKVTEDGPAMEYGEFLMGRAWNYLNQVIDHRKAAWSLLQARDDRPTQYFNAAVLKDDVRAVGLCINDAERMIKGNGFVDINSVVTGRVVQVNMSNFFLNSPRSLQILLPNKYETEEFDKTATRWKTLDGVRYRNYFYGRPTGWDSSKYGDYLKVVGGK